MIGAPKLRVMVVDDSALIRKILSDIINAAPGLEVVGTAPNGQLALARIPELNPDIVTLDVDMPVLDGYTTLKKIMQQFPRPVIMLSGLTQRGAEITFKCLDAGAVDYFPKPIVEGPSGLLEQADDLIEKIRAAHGSRNQSLLQRVTERLRARQQAATPAAALPSAARERIVAIGISTGGPSALASIFPEIPADFPPLLVVQHMPKEFTGAFAERLNKISRIQVKEAEDGEMLKPNTAYIAPGDYHLTLQRQAASCRLVLKHTDKVDGHRPSATVLFQSVAPLFREKTVGVIMTGMGRDGVDGLKEIKRFGGVTVAQDKETSVVYGMPGIAAKENVADSIVPLDEIVPKVVSLLRK